MPITPAGPVAHPASGFPRTSKWTVTDLPPGAGAATQRHHSLALGKAHAVADPPLARTGFAPVQGDVRSRHNASLAAECTRRVDRSGDARAFAEGCGCVMHAGMQDDEPMASCCASAQAQAAMLDVLLG